MLALASTSRCWNLAKSGPLPDPAHTHALPSLLCPQPQFSHLPVEVAAQQESPQGSPNQAFSQPQTLHVLASASTQPGMAVRISALTGRCRNLTQAGATHTLSWLSCASGSCDLALPGLPPDPTRQVLQPYLA